MENNIKAEITKITKERSRYGGEVYAIFMKTRDGVNYKTWVDPKNRNFDRWRAVIEKGVGSKIAEIYSVRKGLINADSYPKFVDEL